jgi:polysaccharide biosynthesis transport protein
MSRDALSPTTDDSLAVRAVEILRRRRILATVVFTTVLASALSFAWYLPDIYEGSAVVLVERQINESFVRPAVTAELESRLHVIKQETLSRARLMDLIKRFDLYPEVRRRQGLEAAIDQTRNDIQVDAEGPEQVGARTKTVAFRLSYTGDSAETAAAVTNAIATFYVSQNDRMRSQEAIQTTEFLKTQLDDAKKALDREEQTLRSYTAANAGAMPAQTGVNIATLERLNTQLSMNADKQRRLLDRREKLLESIPDLAGVVGAIGDEPTAEWLERAKKLTQMREELAQMESRMTPKHPDVVRQRDAIAALEQSLSDKNSAEEKKAAGAIARAEQLGRVTQTRRKDLQAIDAEYDALRKEEAQIRQMMGTFERRLDSTPETQAEYALVSRGYQSAKDHYDSLLRKYDDARLTESMETDRQGENFRILEPAVPPEGPVAPNRVRLAILGFLLAAGIAGMAVVAAEQIDTSFHNVDDLRTFTTVPVLVTIPRMATARPRRVLRAALTTASILAILGIVASASAFVARGNDQLVRLLVRG